MDNKDHSNHTDSSGYDNERVDEMMVLEINFGVGKVDEVIVHFGDDPSTLAEQFATKHNLKKTVIPAISKHISDAILEFTDSNTEMRPQSPSLDVTNDNENIRSDEYLNLQGNQRLPPKDLPPSKTESSPSSSSSPPTATISKETLDKYHSQDSSNKYDTITTENFNHYEISSEQDGTLASSVDIALDYMIEKKSGYFSSNGHDIEGNASRGYQMVNSNRFDSDKYRKHDNNVNNNIFNPEDNYNHDNNDNINGNDDLNRTTQSQNARETTYNRIKKDWCKNGGLNASVDLSKSMSKSKPLNTSKVSTSLNMGKNFDKTPLFTKITGKTANERLYNSAKLINAKKTSIQQKAAADAERELEASKYKINNVSRMLAENKQPHDDSYDDIGHRLHNEGIIEKVKREKLHAEKVGEGPIEEWSCSRCGMFHKLPSTNIFSKNNNLECPNCKWLQSAAIPHHPVNIAMELGSIDPQEVLSKRWQGNTDGSIDLHEYLFANTKLQAKKINNLRSQWADIDLRLPFKPVIPENSELILKQKMDGKSAIGSSLKKKDKNDKLSDQVLEAGEYFHIPAAERLYRHRIKSNAAPLRKKIEISGCYEQEMQIAPKRSSSELELLTSRLTYEYKEKESRRQQAVAETYIDPKTKQPLFKPIVIPAPSRDGQGGISTIIGMDSQDIEPKKRDVFTELLQQSDVKIRTRILDQQRYYEALEEKMTKERATALPQSDQILKEATDRSIEEMYRLLIATSSLDSNDSSADKAELICKMSTDIPNWELQVLDLNNINIEVMIPEIKALVVEVRKEKVKKYEKLSNGITSSSGSQSSLIIDFKEFGTLVRMCLKKRNGPGRNYVYAPKKRPQVTLELLQNELQEETYQPVIDKVSAAIAKERYSKKSVAGANQVRPIEEVLLKEGQKIKEKVAVARKQKEEQELSNLNFKPHIYKTPKSVVPRYRGLPVFEIDGTQHPKENAIVKKTLRGGNASSKKVLEKKPSPDKNGKKPITPKAMTPRQVALTTSEKLLASVWSSLSGNVDAEGNENKQKDTNVPLPPHSSSKPPHPPSPANDSTHLDDKITNRKSVNKGKKKITDE